MKSSENQIHNIAIVTASFPVGPVEGFLIEELNSLASLSSLVSVLPLWPRHIKKCNDSGGADLLSGKVEFIVRPLFDFGIAAVFLYSLLMRPTIVFKWFSRLIFSGSNPKVILKNLAVMPKATWLGWWLHNNNISHVHVHWAATPSTCAAIAADLAGIEWSMTCHRWDIYENNLLALKGRLAKFVRFISSKGLTDAVGMGVPAGKAKLIRMGVKLPATAPDATFIQHKCFIVFCAANLISVKGHVYLIEAVKLLIEQGYNVLLWLAGDGELRNELEQQVTKLNIKDRVKFFGFIDHNTLLKLYQKENIGLFVLPSITVGPGHHEGVPVALMEAMAYGIPVVSTQTGSIEELLPRDLGVTIPEQDSLALAQVIETFIRQPYRRDSIRQLQWEIIQSWSSQLSAKQLLSACGVKAII